MSRMTASLLAAAVVLGGCASAGRRTASGAEASTPPVAEGVAEAQPDDVSPPGVAQSPPAPEVEARPDASESASPPKVDGRPDQAEPPSASAGDGALLNTKRFQFASFFARVRAAIAAKWLPPALPEGSSVGVTLVEIGIDAKGALAEVSLVRSCGVESVDQAAIEAVRAAEPFAVPPASLVDPSTGLLTFRFAFHVAPKPRVRLALRSVQAAPDRGCSIGPG